MAIFSPVLTPRIRMACLFISRVSHAVAVDSSHMTAPSSASWSQFSPPSDFVNGHVSTMWFMVCRWPQPQEGDWSRPHLCKLARHGPWPARKRFIRDHVSRERSKLRCRIVGSVTSVVDHRSRRPVLSPLRNSDACYVNEDCERSRPHGNNGVVGLQK